jgi:SNF2 family DNA or RNA helicase
VHAEVEAKRRIELCSQWNNDGDGGEDCRILLGSVEVLGTGLNFQRGTHIILLDPCWTVGEELQVYARINRLDSPGQTFSYRLVVENDPMENGILQRQTSRREVSQLALKGQHETSVVDQTTDSDL